MIIFEKQLREEQAKFAKKYLLLVVLFIQFESICFPILLQLQQMPPLKVCVYTNIKLNYCQAFLRGMESIPQK